MQYLSSSEVVAFRVPTLIAETLAFCSSGTELTGFTPVQCSSCRSYVVLDTVPLGRVSEVQVLEGYRSLGRSGCGRPILRMVPSSRMVEGRWDSP